MKLTEASILFVDDEPGLRDIFEKWLRQAGCASIRTCADGEEALAALATSSFDLIISDIRMPRLDGVSLVRRRSETSGPIPCVIFISGFGDVVLREMYALGVEAFLPKPTRREEFFRTINRSLAERSELWTSPPAAPSRQLLTDHPQSPRDNLYPPHPLPEIGRGGFSLVSPSPIAPGKVSFDLPLGPTLPRLKGEGHVRWRSSEQRLLGVEFEWLDPSCRRHVVDHIAATHPASYIPDPLTHQTHPSGNSLPLDKPLLQAIPMTEPIARLTSIPRTIRLTENSEVTT